VVRYLLLEAVPRVEIVGVHLDVLAGNRVALEGDGRIIRQVEAAAQLERIAEGGEAGEGVARPPAPLDAWEEALPAPLEVIPWLRRPLPRRMDRPAVDGEGHEIGDDQEDQRQ